MTSERPALQCGGRNLAIEEQGISLWRQIGETLLSEIKRGVLKPGDRVPSREDLAARFGVNRHTAMRAVSFLQENGVVQIRRGRGAFVTNAITYRLGSKTRLEQNLFENQQVPSRRLVSTNVMRSSPKVAEALQLQGHERVAIVTLLGEADGIPVNFGWHAFPLSRIPNIVEAFREAATQLDGKLSITGVLEGEGIPDYGRKSILIASRPPTTDELEYLGIARSEWVLEAEVVNVTPDGRPVMYSMTVFPATRIAFAIEV